MVKGVAFIVMPFGQKPSPDGTLVNFDCIYSAYLRPAVEAAGLIAHRADADRRGGSIHAGMFQDLLLAEVVVADLTLDNPNVWYEIGVRHALRASGAVLTYALRDRLPFDLAGQRMQRYTLTGGAPDSIKLCDELKALTDAITATLEAWRGRKVSPVYAMLPNLREPDWKTLRVGEVNELWQALEQWESRINVARQRQKPGDILVLADEAPNRVLEFEALRTASKALLDLNRPFYALAVLERARALDPDDVLCRQREGIALGRIGRFEQARDLLSRLAEQQRDGETLSLLARTWKDQWKRLWNANPRRQTDAVAAARTTSGTLAEAVQAYFVAFQTNPADFFPGINALTLGRVAEQVTGRPCKLDLDLVAQGTCWATTCAIATKRSYWPLVTRAELSLLQVDRVATLDAYAEATSLAVATADRFALDSSRQTLEVLRSLSMHTDLVHEALQIIGNAESQLDALHGKRPDQPEPTHVVLFSGHMIDRPGRSAPRFPEAKGEVAGMRIAQELDRLNVKAGDLGIAQAACGGDLLFVRACLDRAMRLEVYLPQREPAFLRDSVSFAAAHWQDNYDALKTSPNVLFRVMPDDLGPSPATVDLYDRCNRWMLYSALSNGIAKMSFITLWDGNAGDGPGGAEHMVGLMRDLTGRNPAIIDPATL